MRCPRCGSEDMRKDGLCAVCHECGIIYTINQVEEYWETHDTDEGYVKKSSRGDIEPEKWRDFEDGWRPM